MRVRKNARHSIAAKALTTLCATALLSCLLTANATAAPELVVQLNRTQAPVNVGDERLVYNVAVSNQAGTNPKVDDELTCTGSLSGNPTPTLTYKWLRSGEEIGGETEKTYVVAPVDEGKAIQCVITGTNDPDAALAQGNVYAPVSSSRVSLPPVVVEPTPASSPPSGSTRPSVGGIEVLGPGFSGFVSPATPSGTATVTAGSDILTDVVTTKGTGTLTEGSNLVTGVTAIIGAFRTGYVVSGEGIPGPAKIEEVKETAPGVFEFRLCEANGSIGSCTPVQATASGSQALSAGARPFSPAQKISGPGIPPGTIVIQSTNFGLKGQELRLSNKATASGTNVAISATATEICKAPTGWSGGGLGWSFRWLRNGEEIPGAVGPEYTVQSEDTETPSVLQCEAIAEDTQGRKAISLSEPILTNPTPPNPYSSPSGAGDPTVDFANQTTGPVTLELEAPAGAETYVFMATGVKWSCTKTAPTPSAHATVTCTRSDPLSPGDSFEPVEVVIALGKNPPTTLITKAEASGGGSPLPAFAEDQYTIPNPAIPFGFKAFETEVLDGEGNEYAQAGGHPFSAGADLELNTHVRAEADSSRSEALNGLTKVIRTDVPAGFTGNPTAVGEVCALADLSNQECPAASVVGGISSKTSLGDFSNLPIFAVEPEAGTPAQFAFEIAKGLYTLTAELRPEDGYAVSLVTAPFSKVPEVFSATVDLCGHGAKLTETPLGPKASCRKPNEAGALERPFLTLPTKCGDPASATTEILAESWEGEKASAKYTLETPKGCEELEFEPTIKARPTTKNADSPTGLDFNLHIPQNEDPEGTATSHLKKAVVTLPEGLVVNPSGANGLGACSEARLGMKAGVPNSEAVKCPDSSKIGQVSVTTPILDHPLPGALHIASPHQNPFGSLLALYLVVESPKDGLTIKLAGKVEANQSTGRLTTTFDQNPQAPVEDVELKVRSGASAPLRTPSACGKYSPVSSLTPWSAPQSGPPATPKDSFQISRGPGGGACVTSPPNTPSFEAGTASAIAGAFSPFVLKLRREDGTQQFSEVTITPPPGLVAKLAGTSRCSDGSLALAKAKSGKAEQSSPSCPASSELGSVIAAAGAGPSPYQAQGKAYLAGPYKGAPLSIAIITPATAGPFDLGTVIVRSAVHVDPATARITVKSDPLPRILQGIPLDVRSATVSIDRPSFTLNPTNCDPMAVEGSLLSTLGQSASLENRFQLGECGRLGFKPSLKLKLKGKTKRGDYQGLKATLSARPGDANIASASVTLPRSAFLAQEHIRTVCTRVQFAADQCPKGSVYGKAKAITPLLDEPLQGPVYLRSSNNKLPDLVIALKGPDSLPIEIELSGRTDSKKGALRNTFDLVPDAPVTQFTLELFGGQKGLVVNSRDLCKGTQRASVEMEAQNGKLRSFRPVVGNGCSKKGRKGRHKRNR